MLSLKALNFVSETYFFFFLSKSLSIKYLLSIDQHCNIADQDLQCMSITVVYESTLFI